MINIDSANYQIYRRVYEVFWVHYSGLLSAEAAAQGIDIGNLPSPIQILADVEKKSKSLALKALRAGISDMIPMLLHAPADFKIKIDSDLKAYALPGYFQLYAEASNTLPKVLKRNSILSIEEYYFIIEILDDTTSTLRSEERAVLNTCIIDFELKQAGKH